MKKNNIELCLAVGLFALAVVLIFFEIGNQALIAISISSLVYTLAQTLRNNVELKNEDHKSQLDTFNSIGTFNLNQSQLVMLKRYAPWFFSTKKEKRAHKIATILECVAFAILFVGVTVPIPVLYNDKIGDISTVASFGLLFLSMWQVEKNAERKAQWEDIQLMAMLSQQQPQKTSEDTNNANT